MERLPEYLQNHPWLAALAVVLLVAVIVYELRARGQDYASLPPQEAIRLMNQGAQVVDLREAADYAAGHIANARNIAVDSHAKAGELLKKYREKNVVLYCESGNKAATLARKLHAEGFTKVFNLRGGLAAWRTENLPLTR
jgi:rhodanese-related sulfurtransferase